jgi:perosamine synthetase
MIPVNEPALDGHEKDYLIEAIESGWISSDGAFIKQFEEDFSGYLGAKYGVAVSSGTAALETALYSAGVCEGDEVIMPSFTIISCAIAVIRLGAKPVFVDVESDNWCINVNQIKKNITERTKLIMAVHMYGHPADMTPIMEIANQHDLVVLEDASQVHGAEYKGIKCGAIGHISIFSFYANKIITTGEGGMVITSDKEMSKRARSYRNLCFQEDRRFYHEDLGYNFRMTNLQAAIGVAQVERLDEFVKRKRYIGKLYVDALRNIDGIKTQVEQKWAKMVYWMYCIELDESLGMDSTAMMQALRKRGIGTRPFFVGLHEQPILLKKGLVKSSDAFPVTERISRQGLYLPSGMTLTEKDVNTVVDAIQEIIKESRTGNV